MTNKSRLAPDPENIVAADPHGDIIIARPPAASLPPTSRAADRAPAAPLGQQGAAGVYTLPRPGDRQTPWLDRAGARKKWNDLRLQATDLLAQAARIARDNGLPFLLAQQMRTAHDIAAAHLHQVVGEPEADDADAVLDDLLCLAKTIDALIEAIGKEAKSGLGIVNDPDNWQDQLYDALVGNATFEVDAVARRLEDK